MLQIRLFAYVLIIISLKYASTDEDNLDRRGRHLREFPNVQRTREFGYNIQDKFQQSSHFRKEERDLNGVVRGSYGLKDPNGSFRLVSYIADDKGFRVHISSNERGMGQQNPASVSITHFPPAHPTVTDSRSPETSNRQYENEGKGDIKKSDDWPSNYDFYVPLKQSIGNSEESSKLKPLDLGKHLFEAGFYEKSAISKQNIPSSSVAYDNNSFRDKHHSDSGTQEFQEDSFNAFERDDPKPLPAISDANPNFKSTVTSSTGIRETNHFPTRFLSDTSKLFDEQRGTNNFAKKSDQLPYGILNLLFNHPQQRVHKNLPDCESVKSAVLCKPPPYYYKDSGYLNFTERKSSDDNDPNLTDEYRTLSNEERQKFIESILADRLFKFATSTGKKYPPNMSLSDSTVRSEFFSNLPHNSQKGIPCSETNNRNRQNNMEDLDLTTSLNRPVIYNSISNTHINSLMKYGNDWNPPQLIRNTQQHNEHTYSQNNPTQIDNVDTKENTGGNRRLVLLTTQSGEKSDQSVFELLKKLNILGFIILPGNDKESHQKLIEHIVSKTTEKKDSNRNPNNAPQNSIQNITETSTQSSTELPNTNQIDGAKFLNSSKPGLRNITTKEEDGQSKENQEKPDKKLLLKNSEFLILDDVHDPESGDGDYNSKPPVTTIASTDLPNWRKAFEEELKEEYERAVNKSHTDHTGEPSLNRGIPNERVYHIQDPPTPLYDSRGNPIKSENVPLHLHRYIAPTGITSFPWKFAIPRPAPPRSLVIPPRPANLS
ncbi:Cuticle protein 16.8 like protein [Argiope bruennichi]|uniref:Cuticle protein 16.8 like protein n=1 Tax=Argiope bruennichi TaxID=94029 RepID=A0A8T0EIC4_ARGBR|nr:Cuticle protein 16.8 like protein [Argiope bruennichi]